MEGESRSKHISIVLIVAVIVSALIGFVSSYVLLEGRIRSLESSLELLQNEFDNKYSKILANITRNQECLTAINSSLRAIDKSISSLEDAILSLNSAVYSLNSTVANVTKPKEWHIVKVFNGSSIDTTPPFKIEGDFWRITWIATADRRSSASFMLAVYPVGEERPICVVMIRPGEEFTLTGSWVGVEYLIGEGEYYIKIYAANLKRWRIGIEAYY